MNKLIATIITGCLALTAVAVHAQTSTNPNNTIVRFDLHTEGTNFGSLDIELFDQDKPETVRNFLLYVYSGAYSNVAIHRASSNFVIQAGHVVVPKPDSTDGFGGYTPGRNFGNITNEFSVGPTLSNVFGTIAMARVGGETNSASADWFINLNDNANLDTLDGGFTVFGRVINTDGPNTGTNLLNYFRHITNVIGVLTFSPFDYLSELPFSTYHYVVSTNTNSVYITNGVVITTNFVTEVVTNTAPLQTQDLFTLRPSVIRGRTPEKVKPTVTIKEPSPKARTTTENTIHISGTAKDNTSVERIIFTQPNQFIVRGGDTWATDLTLTPGTNYVSLTSLDQFGNQSKPQKLAIFYRVPTAITVSNIGAGRIIGATNQQLLEIGRNYTFQAKPAKGNFFIGWRGSISSPAPKISTPMQSNMVLTAVFTTNYYPALKGTYNGVMMTRNGGARTAGWITLRLAANGQFTGAIQPMTAKYPIRGAFNSAWQAGITGHRDTNTLVLGLALSTNGPARMQGFYQDGLEFSDVLLYRAESLDSASIPVGQYTFALTPPTNSMVGEGFGIGTAAINQQGQVTVDGTLQNGTPFAMTVPLYAGNHWPFFQRLSASDALIGWMEFNTNNSAFGGVVQWLSRGFTNHFENNLVAGSRYTAPDSGSAALSWTSGTAMLSGDDLTDPLGVDVTLEGAAIVTGTNPVNLHFDAPSADGRFTGSFVHPQSGATAPIQGVFLQSSNIGVGFFQGPNRSGAVRLQAR